MINGQPNYNALPSTESEGKEQVETHFAQGLELMRTQEWIGAIAHFRNGKCFQNTKIDFRSADTEKGAPQQFQRGLTEEEREDIVIDAAGIFFFALGNVRPSMSPNTVVCLSREAIAQGLVPGYSERVYHSIALNCAAGYMDALRYLNGGKPLAGYENENMDLVTYLYQHGVPMTKHFFAERATRKEDIHTPLADLTTKKH